MAIVIVGTWWRHRADQFGWTSGSTQIFEQRIPGWAAPAFHHGAFAAVAGHVIGYQVHAIIAWAFWALFPFSRLVHASSIPPQYLGRPYIVYRRRYAPTPDWSR